MKEKMFPILVGILIVMAFAMGVMWSKLQGLGSGGSGGGGSKTFDQAMADIAKQVKIDGKKFLKCMNSGEKKSIVDRDLEEGTGFGVNGTPAFFINGKFIGGAFPLEAFKNVIDKELDGTSTTDVTKYDSTLQEAAKGSPPAFIAESKDVPFGGAPTRGSGAVKIVEYSDFQCPYCSRVFPSVQQIMKDYDGKVTLAYKHFPLTSIHSRAQKAAEASECARDQGKFWEFHDKLFEKQQEWSSL